MFDDAHPSGQLLTLKTAVEAHDRFHNPEMYEQNVLIGAQSPTSIELLPSVQIGGYPRGADKRTGYGMSSLRVSAPSWNAPCSRPRISVVLDDRRRRAIAELGSALT